MIGVGPTAGALIAWAFYKVIKMLEYEMANPGAYFFPFHSPWLVVVKKLTDGSSPGQESASKEEAEQEAADVTPRKETV